jgi:hypothetical protein
MQHQQLAAIRCYMHGLQFHLNAAKIQTRIGPQRFIMIARNINHPGAMLGFFEYPANHIIMARMPIPRAFQAPAVDDVADQIECIAIGMLEKIHQHVRIAAGRTQMNVRNPDRAIRRFARHDIPCSNADSLPVLTGGLGDMCDGWRALRGQFEDNFHRYIALMPPSTHSSDPVTNFDSSEHKYTAA